MSPCFSTHVQHSKKIKFFTIIDHQHAHRTRVHIIFQNCPEAERTHTKREGPHVVHSAQSASNILSHLSPNLSMSSSPRAWLDTSKARDDRWCLFSYLGEQSSDGRAETRAGEHCRISRVLLPSNVWKHISNVTPVRQKILLKLRLASCLPGESTRCLTLRIAWHDVSRLSPCHVRSLFGLPAR